MQILRGNPAALVRRMADQIEDKVMKDHARTLMEVCAGVTDLEVPHASTGVRA